MTTSKGGRPKKEINKDEFEKLCALQCTKEEIQAWFDVSDKTLDGRIKDLYGDESSFSEVYGQKRTVGKISLRRTQWRMAEKNPTMALWLGKQYLGQTDKQETTHEAGKSITLNYSLNDD